MIERGIIFVDANTIWHRQLAEALGAARPTIALLPCKDLLLRSERAIPPGGATSFVRVGLPPGWAYWTAAFGQALLARHVVHIAQYLRGAAVILTSPAYAPLAKLLDGQFPLVAYIADDYRSYKGWPDVASREQTLMRHSCLSVFVSRALRARAVADGVDEAVTFVSPNATEPRFASQAVNPTPAILTNRPRPVLGILGALTDRLDLDLVRRVVGLSSIGTILVAGRIDPALAARETWLSNPKIVVTGNLPHSEMHTYAHAMDIALIPYSAGALNHYCSPMRLYDHLATGVPIFALDTCDQIAQLDVNGVTTGPADALVKAIGACPGVGRYARDTLDLLWSTRARSLLSAIDASCYTAADRPS